MQLLDSSNFKGWTVETFVNASGRVRATANNHTGKILSSGWHASAVTAVNYVIREIEELEKQMPADEPISGSEKFVGWTIGWYKKNDGTYFASSYRTDDENVKGPQQIHEKLDTAIGSVKNQIGLMIRASSSLEVQHGGNHYKKMKIQVVEFCHANNIPFLEGTSIKHLCRHRDKNKAEDLLKAIHYAQIALELEYGVKTRLERVDSPATG